ncbi:hypothetical protein H5410_058276, partial [Solanum commersonii]
KVVDECDSTRGCDAKHAFQSPCKNNIVDGSIIVWRALGLDTDLETSWCSINPLHILMIRIRTNNGKTVTAKVVDECDSTMGCDAEHAFQSPCKNNIVNGSIAVWRALGLDTNLGIVPVTLSMV